MKATLRSTFMRLTLMAAAIGLLLRAILFDRADMPFAVAIIMAVIVYEGLYHLASRSVRHPAPAAGTRLSH
ncbi:hypothetical protein [Sphingobium sp. Z007]|uniref:hypothetical protein n=1 Tax=Sphingobium sp. Z007 TaxID=627495 RepID=UPI000B49C518|nr:hypothetical protein [Sphingobium sp. Z007]